PDQLTGKREVVEPFALILVHTIREDIHLPRPRRHLEAFELTDRFPQSQRSQAMISRKKMMGLREVQPVFFRGDRLDPFARGIERQAMNAGEQPAFTPLHRSSHLIRSWGIASLEHGP